MKARAAALSALALVSLFAGCQRFEHEQGGVKAGGDISYDPKSDPAVSTISRVSNIAEVAPQLAGGPVSGAQVFGAVCAACHQPTGQGVPGAFPPLDGSSYVTSPNVERAAAIMIYGLQGPIKVKGVQYASAMPPQGHLKDEELAAVLSYVRTSWSNKASPVEPTIFVKVRQKYGQRAPFTIEELGVEAGE